MKKFVLVLIFSVLWYSCQSEGEAVEVFFPAPIEDTPSYVPEFTQDAPAPVPVPELIPDADDFDPSLITPELYDTTKKDVQQLINELNRIIQSKNYQAWVSYLGNDYFAELNSPVFLKQTSESSFLKSKNTVLSSARDYFINVVVPSRANSRVDDIEFVNQKRVKAFTVTSRGQRLRLYDLEDFGDGWKIIN
jgi:hypothetical protein